MEEIARKDVRRATPSGSENDGATQSNENTLDSNIHLKYDVLLIIFRYLNAWDLERVTKVCRLWSEAANVEKQSRGPCHCIINRDKMDDLVRYMKNIRIIPSIGLFFLHDDVSHDAVDLIYNLLPEHCEIIILRCRNYISVIDEEKRLKLIEIIKLFRAKDAGKRKENSEFNSKFDFKEFYKQKNAYYVLHMGRLQIYQEDKIAFICGSLVEDICTSYIASDNVRRKNHPDITAVVLTGSIKMWSIYVKLSPFCDINEQIEIQLNLFKDKVTLKRHSIGFMFTSYRVQLNEEAIEQKTFKRLFPKVPLVVCYDYAHFGEEIEVDKDEKDKYEEDSIGILRFCTMFMIFTYR